MLGLLSSSSYVSRLPLALSLLLLSLASFSNAFPESSFPHLLTPRADTANNTVFPISGSQSLCFNASSTECGFMGDGDTYGLGIRLGVYTQWISSLLAYFFLPDEAASAGGVNTCFTLSNYIGLLFITFGRDGTPPTFSVECWIVLAFCIGGLCCGRSRDDVKEYPRTRIAGFPFRVLSEIPDMLLACAILYYGIWFVFKGVDQTCESVCTRSAFFFTRVDLYHWFRTFNKVILIIAASIVSLILAYTLLMMSLNLIFNTAINRRLRLRIRGWRRESPLAQKLNLVPHKKPKFTLEQEKERQEYNKKQARKRKLSSKIVNTFCAAIVIFFIIAVEFMIKWNNIMDVNTVQGTGQILPLVVGGAGFIRTIWLLMDEMLVRWLHGEGDSDSGSIA